MKILDSKIEELKEKQSELRKARGSMDKELSSLHKKIEKLQEKRDTSILKNGGSRKKSDIEIMLDGNPETTVMYEYQKKLFENIGLMNGGYSSSYSGQTIIQIALNRRNNKKTAVVYAAVCKLLPYLKPYEKDSTTIQIGIFEHTLAEFGPYYLYIEGNSAESKCYVSKHRYYIEDRFDNLQDALKYIQKTLWYGE